VVARLEGRATLRPFEVARLAGAKAALLALGE